MDHDAVNVLILPRYTRRGASSRHRFYQFIPELEQRGMRVTVDLLLDDAYLEARYAGRKPSLWRLARAYMRRMGILLSVHRFDLVWLEKELFPLLPALGETFLSWIGPNYVVDYDDATFHSYELHPNPLVRYLLRSKIDTVMRRAHVVVAGNAYLAARARKAGAARIVEFPTLVDLDRYDLHPKTSDAPFTIGWIGSPTTADYLDLIRPALAKFSPDSQGFCGVREFDEPQARSRKTHPIFHGSAVWATISPIFGATWAVSDNTSIAVQSLNRRSGCEGGRYLGLQCSLARAGKEVMLCDESAQSTIAQRVIAYESPVLRL